MAERQLAPRRARGANLSHVRFPPVTDIPVEGLHSTDCIEKGASRGRREISMRRKPLKRGIDSSTIPCGF
jgi:hypothetical protein